MAKLASTGCHFYFATGAKTVLEVVSVTKAHPAVMTVTDVGVVSVGDFVSIAGGNWASLAGPAPTFPGKVFVAGAVDPVLHTIELRGSNTLAEVATFDPTDATVVGTAAVESCIAHYTRSAPPASQLDVTTMCDTVRKKVAGLRDSGSFRFDGFYDSQDLAYAQIRKWFETGSLRRVSVVPPDKSVMIFDAYCTMLGETMGVDQPITIQGEGMIEGTVFFYGANTWIDPDPVGTPGALVL